MKLGKHVLADLEIETLHPPNTLTSWSHTVFQEGLKEPTSDVRQLKRIQLGLMALRKSTESQHIIRTHLQNLVVPNMASIDACCHVADPRVEESIHQILWPKKSFFSFFNIQAAILSFLVVWKTLVLPGISVVMPLLAVIVPFFIHRYVFGTPISLGSYTGMLKQVLLKQVSIPSALRAKGPADTIGNVLETLFLGITVATFVSGIWNQISAALHLRRIAADIEAQGKAIRQLREAIVGITDHLKQSKFVVAFADFIQEAESILHILPDVGENLAAFGHIWNDSTSLLSARNWIGRLDIYQSLASLKNICFPRYISSAPLHIRGVYHPTLESQRVQNDAEFTKNHVLLTGPNRGGKSTFCRSVGLAILTAQTWGFAWASSMSFSPFAAFETALKTRDELGSLSLFEAEIEFAKSVLTTAREGLPSFIMMDEIFHSTNAHDGVAASRIFLHQLYEFPTVSSIISTHYQSLVEHFQQSERPIQAWCLDARQDEATGRLTYTYKVVPGISDKSSVLEILYERGLVQDIESAAKLLKRVPSPQSEALK